jgi:N-methylhydantoinase A
LSAGRLAIDIGGTFTDLALEIDDRRFTAKLLTTTHAPEVAAIEGIGQVLRDAGIGPGQLQLVIHGTTLATNALIERKGAKTALVATQGHRDTLDLAYEDRFSEYDVFIEKPPALVPRDLRFTVPERMNAKGEVLLPLDEEAVRALVPELNARGVEAVAVGFLHAYANPRHEQRVGAILAEELPGVSVTLSSAVCPEVREYDRLSTAAANAYVQPLMAGYLQRMERMLREAGIDCPLLLMLSGGGLCTVETARRLPIRLVESGPAGGAILAGWIAAELGLEEVLSYDMGGTTAKICLIDHFQPHGSRSFEVGRIYRFLKGSGLPLRIPVIEMVEIGAGGGSIARVDLLQRMQVGPDSAGADPGPACYGRGGTAPTVTDADLALGRIDPDAFAAGRLRLDPSRAAAALEREIGDKLRLGVDLAAYGISEVVDENMANAARVHSVERGKALAGRTLVAFGGAAPLHAGRLAEKVEIDRIVVPTGAGVGSAIGFLRAPVAYDVVRSRYMRLKDFAPAALNAMLGEMRREAAEVVALGAPGKPHVETRTADMRYIGQGHEIAVEMPARDLTPADAALIRERFEARYSEQYGRPVAGVDIEILAWSLNLRSAVPSPSRRPAPAATTAARLSGERELFDPASGQRRKVPVYLRDELSPGARLGGPALIAEAQTTTVVPAAFDASIDAFGYILLERRRDQR